MYLVIRVIRVMKDVKPNEPRMVLWSEWDNAEQAEHDCQLIHNDAHTSYAFVAQRAEFSPDDTNKR